MHQQVAHRVPDAYQAGTRLVRTRVYCTRFAYHTRTDAYHTRTICVPFTYQMRTSSVPDAYHKRTKCVSNAYQLSTRRVPLAYQVRTICVQNRYHTRTIHVPCVPNTYQSSNRLWAYTGENFISPMASKICPLHNPTTICKGTDHCLTPKLNIYTKIRKYIGIY